MEQKIKIWVMWSAQGPTIWNNSSILLAKALWEAIAKSWCILITWACPGLPNEAAIWARGAWWYVIWVSPAFSEEEHKKSYRSPLMWYDIVLYTWAWLLERDIVNIRASDAIIIIWGWVWTLNEFTIAYDEGKLVWVLQWTWWISDSIPRILEICGRSMEDRVIISKDPNELVSTVLLWLKKIIQPTFEDESVKSKF